MYIDLVVFDRSVVFILIKSIILNSEPKYNIVKVSFFKQ
jgi:hypothetical protein